MTADRPFAYSLTRLRPAARLLACLGSVEEAVEWPRPRPVPDVLFCDIYLSDGNSFDIFRPVAVPAPVIFTTAYDASAIQAIQANSVDCLLKPLQTPAVERALRKYEARHPAALLDEVEGMQWLVHSTPRSLFLVKSGQTLKTLPVGEVACFLAEEGVAFLVTHAGKRFIIANTPDQLEASTFFRINGQIIFSIGAVPEIQPSLKGRLVLAPPVAGEAPVVSTGRAPVFRLWLDYQQAGSETGK